MRPPTNVRRHGATHCTLSGVYTQTIKLAVVVIIVVIVSRVARGTEGLYTHQARMLSVDRPTSNCCRHRCNSGRTPNHPHTLAHHCAAHEKCIACCNEEDYRQPELPPESTKVSLTAERLVDAEGEIAARHFGEITAQATPLRHQKHFSTIRCETFSRLLDPGS